MSVVTVIEFVGMPGVGKSTIAHALAAHLRATKPVVEPTAAVVSRSRGRRLVAKLRYAARAIIADPRRSLTVTAGIARTRQQSIVDLGKVLLNAHYIRGVYRMVDHDDGVVVLDQGMYQAMWSCLFSATDPEAAIDHLKDLAIPQPDIVVEVDAALATVDERIRTRMWGHTRLTPGSADHDRATEAMDHIEAAAERNGPLLTVQNDTPNQLDRGVANLAARIRSQLD